MDDAFAMDVLETMASMLEVLVARIEVLEKKLNEVCSCKQWENNHHPDFVIQTDSEIMPQG